jgi:16S rRNA G966 N2-methylase RsmD
MFIKNHENKNYDMIFIDAPFDTNDLYRSLKLLDENGFLLKNKFIYIEQNKNHYNAEAVSIISKTHNILKDLSIGDVSYTIAKKRDK